MTTFAQLIRNLRITTDEDIVPAALFSFGAERKMADEQKTLKYVFLSTHPSCMIVYYYFDTESTITLLVPLVLLSAPRLYRSPARSSRSN